MKNRSQIFSTDLLVALIVFVFILVAVAWVWDYSWQRINLEETRSSMVLATSQSLSLLIQHPGNPSDWENLENEEFNITNVHSLGITSSSVQSWNLDDAKIRKLYELDATEYEVIKQILGLQGPGYEFYLQIRRAGGIVFPGFLGGKVIAYTYAEGDSVEGNASKFGIYDYLVNNSIPFADYDNDWESMIDDIDQYEVLILEDPQLGESDLSQEQLDILENWVLSGGIYFQKQYGRLIELFNVTTNNVAHEEGTVVALDGMLGNVEIGDDVWVKEGYRVSKQGPITPLVIHDSSLHMLIGYWDYGEGRIYYMPDTEGEVFNGTGFLTYDNTRILLKLPENKETVGIGIFPPNNASNIAVENRMAILDDAFVNITLMVWERCTVGCT